MGLLDHVSQPNQRVAYMFPELGADGANAYQISSNGAVVNGGFDASHGKTEDIFVFQFWPQQVQDSYTPTYTTKTIPGASHPLQQWTGGSGRNISFTANFVSELREDAGVDRFKESDFRTRLTSGASNSITTENAFSALLLPSTRYTVNVSAAIAALQKYLYPTYINSRTRPPRKLILVLPGTKLGRADGADGILCILKSAPITMESWFPDGSLRAVSMSLQFSEIIQHSSGGDGVSKIKYIGAESYTALAKTYELTSSTNELSLG
jgi:hypothetical protein